MKKTKKGSILIEAVISIIAVTVAVAILMDIITIEKRINNLPAAKDMNKYWRNLERYKLYCPIELPVDIVLSN
ncbi:MAG: hypothetical protein ACOX1F_07060 [Erysipelotrichaceae bacterium]|jgi:hypothetical protein